MDAFDSEFVYEDKKGKNPCLLTLAQQVHLKILELSKEGHSLSVDTVKNEFNTDISKNLEALLHLRFINAAYFAHGRLELTESGKRANIPR